ncbi:hypothetical protein I3J27_32760 [Bradyrhizobium xenonodulans]|uniref:Uncharacterized protein n=1 Tax=Bradyrhizobium xenonodulans TaxID=2736875 RepID=A0ABY7MLE4_9BRAD|nr:hypothetical protein [Bradyrhizobium xenonodulans]WBL77740.1 hypothetical protein I3J27_32760 [Bradyrhizobium xenonodulans]
MDDVVGAASTLLVVCRIEASRRDAHRLRFSLAMSSSPVKDGEFETR